MPFAALFLALSAPAEAALRHAVVVGSNHGSEGLEPLQFAEDDATRFADVLVELGAFDPGQVTVLRGADRKAIEVALRDHAALASREPDDFFVFYYSGHADQTGLRLGDDVLSFTDLRGEIRRMDSEIRLGILDACRSGEITRTKGMTVDNPFADVTDDRQTEGEAWLTAASADEAAQESDKIRGSFFTHYLLSALRGAADQGDGVVSLGEAYAYAYDRTVARTGATSGGTQHPTYDYRITGRGDLPLTDVAQGTARLVLPAEMAGVVSVLRLPDRTPLAEIAKTAGASVRVAVPPGSYALVLRDGSATAEASVGLSDGAERVVSGLAFQSTEIELASAKGGTVENVVEQWRKQANETVTALFKPKREVEAVHAPLAATGAVAWPGDVAPVLACADRGQGCLREAFANNQRVDGPIEGHAADGSLAFTGKSAQGLPTGFWTFYYPSGAPHCEGAVVSGVKDGSWKCSYESGAVESTVQYRADFEVGTRTEYYANGQKKKRLDLVRGVASGRAIEWHENGKRKSDGRLAGGHPVGTWTYFFDTGGKQEQGRYDLYGKKGRWHAWYVNGQKASIGRYVRDARDGEWEWWWPDGQRKASGKYERGLEVGHWREWYESGHRAAEGRYDAGTRVGQWREWEPSGARKRSD
jgi:antitoxin component YwqK of YwqJK toxin-antitoxin module